ncbi:gliding motility-associated protein GldE, partial [Colwellia ponticola]
MGPEPSLFFSYAIDANVVFGFVGIAILLFCSALISGAEVALFSLLQKDIDEIVQKNNSK